MIEVTCAIIVKEDKILVTQRSEKMAHPLKWEFPGGKIEKGESAEECLKREIMEELGIEIEIRERLEAKCHDYNDFSINLIPFIADYVSGEIVLNEHKCFKWLSKEELESQDWASADIHVLEELKK